MYLHIGQDTVVKLDEIVAIFDIETSSISKTTRQFLSRAQNGGQVVNVTGELPKSFIVCREKTGRKAGRTTVYISQISSTTLLKRSTSFGKDL